MTIEPARIFSLGDNAVTVEFGNTISEPLNNAAVSLARHFNENPFDGFVEAVPAIASTTIFYRSPQVLRRDQDLTVYASIEAKVREAAAAISKSSNESSRMVEIPVGFTADDALDLVEIAQQSRLSPDEVIEMFLDRTYRVYMLGFLPGFAYLGTVDERIAMPRRSSPRVAVPKGSVGIAGRQTGIYPAESPAGWQIVGRTDIELVTGGTDSPCLLAPGDSVRFVRSDK